MVQPIKSTSFGEGSQLLAITLWLFFFKKKKVSMYNSFKAARIRLNLHLPRFVQYQLSIKRMHQDQIATEIRT